MRCEPYLFPVVTCQVSMVIYLVTMVTYSLHGDLPRLVSVDLHVPIYPVSMVIYLVLEVTCLVFHGDLPSRHGDLPRESVLVDCGILDQSIGTVNVTSVLTFLVSLPPGKSKRGVVWITRLYALLP